MQSCLYEGWVRHRRQTPVAHRFRYRLFLAYLDLAEVADLPLAAPLWGADRVALAAFHRRDHLGDRRVPLIDSVRELLAARGIFADNGPIRLLTHLRYCGYVMNPVSFYYCFESDDRTLAAVVAEVNNTPWGEQHLYVLEPRQRGSRPRAPLLRKEFHVSPFMSMDVNYRWRWTVPGDDLHIVIHNFERDARFFDVGLHLQRRPLNNAQLARMLLRYPLMTARVTTGIYWQALRLWWKGNPYHPHPRTTGPTFPQSHPAPTQPQHEHV